MRIRAILAIVALSFPARAFAGESGEPVSLVVDAPPACLTEAKLVEEVTGLGAPLRVAGERARTRRFEVRVFSSGAHFVARLTVRDLVGRETVRSVENETCTDAGRSASLLVSLALDEEQETPTPVRMVEQPFRWPQPATIDAPTPAAPSRGRVGSGGVVVNAFYGRGNGRPGAELYGAKAYAAWRFGATRIGGAIALQRDSDSFPGTHHATLRESDRPKTRHGTSGRVGAVVGWGAPWSDSIVGFLGEVGAAAGEAATIDSSPFGIATRTERYASPYAAASLILQVPWKHSVRPVVGLGAVWTPSGPESQLPVAFAGDAGLAWQAW